MEKFRICPTCGTKNPPTLIECLNCETDLTGVLVGETTTEYENTDESSQQSENLKADTSHMVRVCECGAENPPSARKCSVCGEDISDIIPTQNTQPEDQEQVRIILSSLDGTYAFELVDNLTMVGRENIMREYLSAKSFVSRKHAEFLSESGKLWIKNHSSTNHTYVNNDLIKDNEFIELHDGDIIGLGGKEINGSYQEEAAYFVVRIGNCI